ncbi:hypothetical protein [Bacillus sp. FJAT-45350]|uniref:hypothetical protein n=1 Tax=Bacillus sp. FJAT-45350 TaxID=2011014 RepID=UPI000BB6C075|nr:hypothetical protein [Bacillus sp. FJAT-45350]
MEKLTKQLEANLLGNPAVQIKQSATWYLPVQRLDVAFQRVRKAQMDILMKMMLLTFEEAEIRRAANLAEILLVEELFITDLLEKMVRTGLIQLQHSTYKLTTKGKEQLISGIVEEELEEEETELLYSPSHDELWQELTLSFADVEDLTEYRYASNQGLIEPSRIMQVLAESRNGLDENGFQTVVSEITSFEQQVEEQIPCIEFQMYNKEQDIFYARVWNTLLQHWDDTLEKQIEEHEMVKWRDEQEKEAETSGK